MKNKRLFLSVILVLLVISVAIFAPVIAPADPYDAVMEHSLQGPSGTNICGTDKLGRDVFSRVIYGTRTSLVMTFTLVASIFVVGTLLGVISGYFGGIIDAFIMRIGDMMMSFPGLVLAIAIAGLMGTNVINAVIAIAVVSWPRYARLARSLTLQIKKATFIEAAWVAGTGHVNMIRKYFLPNIISNMIVTATADLGTMMLELAALSFLGFGATAPTPEWGLMLNEGRAYLSQAPWLMIYPGIAIAIVVATFHLLGDSIRDTLDPKQI